MSTNNNVIISRNQSLIAWLEDKGIQGHVVEHATAGDVAHRHVYGIVPFWMAAFADTVSEVNMPGLDRTERDRFNRGALTVQEMDAAGAELVTYRVRRV
jgi:hypothetical protein